MSRYQITIRNPLNNHAWRIRTTTAAEFADISSQLLIHASKSVKFVDLQALWPAESAAKWHAYGDDVFQSLLRWAHTTISQGDFDAINTGRNVFRVVSGHMQAAGWKEITCDIGKRLAKILIRVAIAYLRSQFPAIGAANAGRALVIFDRLLARPSAV